MSGNQDQRIVTEVPFLQDDTIMYLGSQNGTALDREPDLWDSLSARFADAGYYFLSLPQLEERLTSELRAYLLPGSEDGFSVDAMYERIRLLAGIGEQSGFLYRQGRELYFRPVSLDGNQDWEKLVDDFIDYLQHLQGTGSDTTCFRMESARRSRINDIAFSRESDINVDILGYSECIEAKEKHVPEEDSLGERTQAILAAWEKIEREFGITIEDLDILLGYRVKLSKLFISTSNRLFLKDFNNAEVKLDDLTKAVYYFYLKHPEGATLKSLQEDHQEEILKYYMGITGRDDKEKIRESVGRLLDPYGNALNVSMSRIKKAFRDVIGDRVARFYYIDGRSGGVRSISLDRDLVIWEW